jgi:hypothetical protein
MRCAVLSTRSLDIRVLGRRDANEELVPSMMLARHLSASTKVLVEHLAILHSGYINQTPSGNGASTFSAYLQTKQSLNSFLNTVIMGLDNSFVAFVSKPKQESVFDC